ncbi:MAG: hypothetical protein SFY32_08490 [Bacteroidota bacterium]|nr:hypothetical protein [Bacteroidota bacterium]
MKTSAINTIIEDFYSIKTIEDKEYAVEILRKSLVEAKRDLILVNSNKSNLEYNKGVTKSGNLQALKKDLDDN